MKPLFFGSTGAKLYGCYHPPDPARDKGQGVLVANPIGHEYIRSHRVIQQLSCELASQGHHVLRFDYSGLGNSDGVFSEMDFSIWQENLVAAKAELKSLAGLRKISVLAIRLGAIIAQRANTESGLKIRDHLYWSPIIDGAAYLDGLQKSHEIMLRDSMRFKNPVRLAASEDYQEMMGFRYSKQLCEQLRSISPSSLAAFFEKGSFNILVESDQEAMLRQIKVSADINIVSSQSNVRWDDPYKIESTIVAPKEVSQLLGMVR